MNDLMDKFLTKSSGNRELYERGVLEGDSDSLTLLRERFEDFIFEIYFLSYVKKSITYKSFQEKEKGFIGKRSTNP